MPKVSVVMPAYNAAKYIKSAIESVLSQTFDDFELLVINDASTDDTAQIVRDIAAEDERVVLLQNDRGKGVAGAINTGLEHSRGQYIARADADDISYPERFQKQVDYLDLHPEIFLLGTGVALFDDHGPMFNVVHPSSSAEIAWRFVSRITVCHAS
jgi:glycosyltransferase involved in cell wall biosynthesis